MPNWASCALQIENSPGLEARLEGLSIDEAPIENLFEALGFGVPKELLEVAVGSAEIDGKRVNRWRVVKNEAGENEKVEVTAIDQARLRAKYGFDDWYAWALANWGTKWDTDADYAGGGMLHFDSAWSPPEKFVKTLSERYPDATFTLAFAEGGCAYWGTDVYRGGVHISGTYSEQFWGEQEYDEDVDLMDMLVDECREHIEDWGLHTGG